MRTARSATHASLDDILNRRDDVGDDLLARADAQPAPDELLAHGSATEIAAAIHQGALSRDLLPEVARLRGNQFLLEVDAALAGSGRGCLSVEQAAELRALTHGRQTHDQIRRIRELEALRGDAAAQDSLSVDELAQRPAEDIDYRHLDDARLLELATRDDAPAAAMTALGELQERRAPEAWTAARAIVERGPGDRFLGAMAIATLFEIDATTASALATAALPRTTEPLVLEAMLDPILDAPERFTDRAGRAFIDALVERARCIVPDEHTDEHRWQVFLDRFGGAAPGR